MSNFQFLHPEFKPLLESARGAEQLVHSDSRASCMRARFALEQPHRPPAPASDNMKPHEQLEAAALRSGRVAGRSG